MLTYRKAASDHAQLGLARKCKFTSSHSLIPGELGGIAKSHLGSLSGARILRKAEIEANLTKLGMVLQYHCFYTCTSPTARAAA